MDKDIIKVSLEDGTTKDMELVLLYKDEKSNINYVLYKEIDKKDECYAAKYKINNSTYELDSNLTKNEIIKLQAVLNSVLKENN